MTVWYGMLLGLVEGVAEFIPVSSSGHLAIINNLFNMSSSGGHSLFDGMLKLGVLISLLIVFWGDLQRMVSESLIVVIGSPDGEDRRYPGVKLLFMLLMSSLGLILAIPFAGTINKLFYHKFYVGIAMVLNGAMLYVADRMIPGKKSGGAMTVLDAILIGICHSVGFLPGLSAFGVTVVAGMAIGLRRDFAVRFAFLASIPALLGSAIVCFVRAGEESFAWASFPAYLVGMAVAILTGIVSISLMRIISNKGKFGAMAYYCWLMGVLGMILTMIF